MVELKVFLISNDEVNKIGEYDADGEVFERKATSTGTPVTTTKTSSTEDAAEAKVKETEKKVVRKIKTDTDNKDKED